MHAFAHELTRMQHHTHRVGMEGEKEDGNKEERAEEKRTMNK
jgi:hypothetical protein